MKNLASSIPSTEEGTEHRIISQIHRSELYQNYERAFVATTGLSLRLASAGGRLISTSGPHHQNPFCELLCGQNRTCEPCERTRRNLTFLGELEPHTSSCFAGLCESCIPIRTSGKTIGYLLTGEVTISRLPQSKFAKITETLKEIDMEFNEPQLRRAYFSTRIMSRKHYGSILELLDIFAGHLSLLADHLILRVENGEAPEIQRAREFINRHFAEPLDLKQVANSAHLSSCYFSKKFKQSTGLTFTAYVARTRVEAARKLLANPRTRVSEVAFEVGFRSLTHFNRVFRKISGQSPTRYRENLPDLKLSADCHPVLGKRRKTVFTPES